jgi:hypothetical protein
LSFVFWLAGGDNVTAETPVHDISIRDANAAVQFTRRPRLVRAEQRLGWRLGLVVIVLSRFNRTAGTVGHLHVLSWALRSQRSRQVFLAFWEGRRAAGEIVNRMDPSLPLTLSLAAAHGLIEVKDNRRVGLTESGKALAKRIKSADDLFATELGYLDRLGSLRDARMERLLGPVGSVV